MRADQHRECADTVDTPEGSDSFFALTQLILFLQALLDVLQKPHQCLTGLNEGLSRWAS